MSKLLLAGAMVCVWASTLAGQKVEAKTYEKLPPGTFTTYHWHPGRTLTPKGLIEEPTVEALVKAAVDKQMTSRGFHFDPASPLEISYGAGVTMNARLEDNYIGDYMSWTFGVPFTGSTRAYQKNGLLLTVVDVPKNRSTVWAAIATDNFKPDNLPALIDKAVAKAFQKFPLKP